MHGLKKGILIAIEGIDGSGKSSLAKNLHQELLNQKYEVLLTKRTRRNGIRATIAHARTRKKNTDLPEG